ncbi:beta-1,3-galactosyltransferase 1-like isoform X2 [Patiria miniata]|uniref:Hexosyltransferase n=1 Tax=Patiria miniata TaxID=46514 RepID=A0A913ZYK2_PATMI|nr:beta-1,3-galactosyltransferase 1-like isoform X2 [Patiria miniata]
MVDSGMKVDKKTCAYLWVFTAAVICLVSLSWSIRAPGNILRRSGQDGDQPNHGEVHSNVTTEAINFTNYRELLKTAYDQRYEGHINPHDFSLVLDEPLACMEYERGRPRRVFLLVLVATSPANFKRRQAVRETWGSPAALDGRAIVTLFLLGKTVNSYLYRNVLKESAEHHDLLMEDFADRYKNLTLKTMMAMKWASTHCPQASFVMKTDDDMFVSYRNLLDYLAAMSAPDTGFALGRVLEGKAPFRDPKSKYFVSKEAYPGDVYPPWLSGGGFVLSGDMPGRIYSASLDTRFLYLEDVYVGMCLQKLKVTPIMSDRFNNVHIGYSYCMFRYLITSHRFDPEELRAAWKDMLVPRTCWFWT